MFNRQNHAHNPEVLSQDSNATRVICKECKEQFVIRNDQRGVPLNRQYQAVYRKDTLQANTNLFYKYYNKNIRT
jgi:hypothetical protein